jgi:hypothetical protein
LVQQVSPRGHCGSWEREPVVARATRGETPGITIVASDAPMTRTARRRGIGSASVRASSSKKRSVLTG